MASASVAAFFETVRQCRLLESAQLEELASLQSNFADPKALAAELIQRGWLTPYQVEQIFLGKAQELVLETYVILERIGEGGMGAVYKARHLHLDRLVAIKVIRPDRVKNPDTVKRFHREVRAAAQLNHPNIVRAYDAGQVRNVHYMAMEYVEGTDYFEEKELNEHAWFGEKSGNKTQTVGKKKPNTWGLHDIAGNVYEWTGDWYGKGYYEKSPREDPAGPGTGINRVIRDGGFSPNLEFLRSANRYGIRGPSYRSQYIGFRVVFLP